MLLVQSIVRNLLAKHCICFDIDCMYVHTLLNLLQMYYHLNESWTYYVVDLYFLQIRVVNLVMHTIAV